jgi:hypothetical protein
LLHLRFTPTEYRALALMCSPLDLDDNFFPTFKGFLVNALLDTLPDLAKRIALFNRGRMRLLFDNFREKNEASREKLTADDFRALAQACGGVVHPPRFLHSYHRVLVRHFRQQRPALARKLARLSADQFAELYGQVRERKKG